MIYFYLHVKVNHFKCVSVCHVYVSTCRDSGSPGAGGGCDQPDMGAERWSWVPYKNSKCSESSLHPTEHLWTRKSCTICHSPETRNPSYLNGFIFSVYFNSPTKHARSFSTCLSCQHFYTFHSFLFLMQELLAFTPCSYMVPHARTFSHVPPHAATCFQWSHMLPHTPSWSLMLPPPSCSHMVPYASTCLPMHSHILTCSHMPPDPLTFSHMLPHIPTCSHMLSFLSCTLTREL